MIGIRDKNRSMTVLTDRALGGTGFKPGRVELLINRKTKSHDRGGMGRKYDIKSELIMEMKMHFDWKTDRENLLEAVYLRNLFARLLPMQVQLSNPLQMFTYFGQGYKTIKANNPAEKIRKELLYELKNQEIVDMMLFPAENTQGKLVKMQVRLTTKYDGTVLALKKIGSLICKFSV